MLQATHLVAGTVVGGDYRVVEPLARGGMGSVYVVEQLSTGRRRALKVLHAQLNDDEGMRARFEREARVGARIESEHVVEVLAAGVDGESGLPWLVMELLEGEDLADHLARHGPLDPGHAGGIVAQLCHALAAAHAVGVVHRDLKPENVFLAKARRLGADFTVKVLDFGIAKIVADAKSRTTDAVGTPLFMAPEQTAAGEAIGPPADVWALGLVVFTLLTGKSYWKGAESAGSSAMAVLREVAYEPLVPASVRAQELGVEDRLPMGFDGWFARAVAREPSARFQNAAEAQRALAALGMVDAPLALAATQPIDAGTLEAIRRSTPDQRVPTARETGMGHSESVAPPAQGRGKPWVAFALVVAAGIVALVVLSVKYRPEPPALPASTTASADPSSTAADVEAPGAASAQRGPLVHICDAARGDPQRWARCKEPSFAWCDGDERFVACCAKSMVPVGESGACGCAPGGALGSDALAAGCPKAEGAQGLPSEVAKSVIKASFPQLTACYRRELEGGRELRGRVELALDITPWGDVFEARIVKSSFPSPAAQECFLRVARELRFPPLNGGGTLRLVYPVVLGTNPDP